MITEHDAEHIKTGDTVYSVSNKGRGVFAWEVLTLRIGNSTLSAKSTKTGEVRRWPLSCLYWNAADAMDANEVVMDGIRARNAA